jgi:hypothetical protein
MLSYMTPAGIMSSPSVPRSKAIADNFKRTLTPSRRARAGYSERSVCVSRASLS